jgi:hypothetical protein
MPQVAAGLWARVLAADPDRLEATDGYARTLRDQGRYDEAIATLRAAALEHPEDARLWNSLGVTLAAADQPEAALTFFDEAVRLDPRSATAHYNRGGARFDLADLAGAADDYGRAAKLAKRPGDAAMVAFARATLLLAQGDLAAGWDAYEARFHRDYGAAPIFEAPGQRWRPGDKLEGRRLLVVGEQGLGDELMFANLLPDVAEALGPEGRLTLAVEPRLVGLFARSFPGSRVIAHATDRKAGRRRRSVPDADRTTQLWAPMGSLCRRFRRAVDTFPDRAGYLRADPARVDHWRGWLGAGPPVVGVTWRSGQMLAERRRQYPRLQDWVPLLKTSGVRFLNLQYGDSAEEIAALRDMAGVEIVQPPGIDLREDIDDLAALCCALDLVVAVANATGALAGACGAPLALLSPAATWPRLGTAAYPWYPQAAGPAPRTVGDWAEPLAEAAALAAGLARRV